MANALYPLWKQSLMAADPDSDLIQAGNLAPHVVLIDATAYTYSPGHQFFASLTGVIGSATPLLSPTVIGGVFDAADVTLTAVSGPTARALVVFRRNAGANTTWRLVYYCDTGVVGLPVVPNGNDILIQWNMAGIFAL